VRRARRIAWVGESRHFFFRFKHCVQVCCFSVVLIVGVFNKPLLISRLCVCGLAGFYRNYALPNKKPLVSPKPSAVYQDTSDGPSAATNTEPPKMSQVLGQLRRAPPTTTNDGDYSSIDLVRTAGSRAQSSGVEGASQAPSCPGQPQNVYGPLLMQPQQQSSQDTDSTYAEIGIQ